MKFTTKELQKELTNILRSLDISFDLANELSWRQLYKLFKLAIKTNNDFNFTKKELKTLAKEFSSLSFEKATIKVSKTSEIVKIIKEKIATIQESFKFLFFWEEMFIQRFLSFFKILRV